MQDLMEALLLMESCLDPKWFKPWYRPAQHKMQSTSHLLRLSTPAAVALHLFALDRAILYDKVRRKDRKDMHIHNKGVNIIFLLLFCHCFGDMSGIMDRQRD